MQIKRLGVTRSHREWVPPHPDRMLRSFGLSLSNDSIHRLKRLVSQAQTKRKRAQVIHQALQVPHFSLHGRDPVRGGLEFAIRGDRHAAGIREQTRANALRAEGAGHAGKTDRERGQGNGHRPGLAVSIDAAHADM